MSHKKLNYNITININRNSNDNRCETKSCCCNYGSEDWGLITDNINCSRDFGLITEFAPPVKYFLELEGV